MTPSDGAGAPTILYVDCVPEGGMARVRMAGIRRYAATRGWRVETLEHGNCSPKTLAEALARLRPVGCVAECWDPRTALRPALFGSVPVVYFSPPNRRGWHGARGVVCDEAAVARMAFRELSDGNPLSYAVLSFWRRERWARERIDAFRECCRKAGFDCRVTCFKGGNYHEMSDWIGGLVPWAAALPPRCAVFAVNDFCALAAAKALAAAGRTFPRSVTLVGVDGIETAIEIKELVETISTVRLDFELAGYLAARLLAELAMNNRAGCEMKGRTECEMKGRAGREMKGRTECEMKGRTECEMKSRAGREMNGAACAANEFNSSFAPPAHTSFGGNAATLHCGNAATSFAPPAHASFGGNAATLHCGNAATSFAPPAHASFDGDGDGGAAAVFPPLMVDRRKSTRGHGRREPRILEAMEMIRREACDGLSVASLASRFPGTRRLFEMRFREAAGHSALDEIMNVRLARAIDLLANTDMPIEAVANFSGFQTGWEFWHFFRKRTGTTPARFRRDRRKSGSAK